MKVSIIKANIGGEIKAIASKSHAHRLLICASFCNERTDIICKESSDDIEATKDCLNSLCAEILKTEFGFKVSRANYKISGENILRCGESGSTYRFLLPVACALGSNSTFLLEGRLPLRPMEPLYNELENHGIKIAGKGTEKVTCSGRLTGGDFVMPGNISSQFISGLIFALPLLSRDSRIKITSGTESKSYIDITLDAVKQFGIKTEVNDNIIYIPGNQEYISPGSVTVEGDWSNAAFWLCAAAAGNKTITCSGLNKNTLQGDKAICEILSRFGASVTFIEDKVTVSSKKLNGITIDAREIPDLIPAIAVVAAVASGNTTITNAERLMLKESNRLNTIAFTMNKLGADINETLDGLTIKGKPKLSGGTADSCGDHRIAMMASIAASVCEYPVTVEDAQAVSKSYPGFFKDYEKLGAVIYKEQKKSQS